MVCGIQSEFNIFAGRNVRFAVEGCFFNFIDHDNDYMGYKQDCSEVFDVSRLIIYY